MSRNEYIKFCDKYNIKDGIVREMLIQGNEEEICKALKAAIDRRKEDIKNLTILYNNFVPENKKE